MKCKRKEKIVSFIWRGSNRNKIIQGFEKQVTSLDNTVRCVDNRVGGGELLSVEEVSVRVRLAVETSQEKMKSEMVTAAL